MEATNAKITGFHKKPESKKWSADYKLKTRILKKDFTKLANTRWESTTQE